MMQKPLHERGLWPEAPMEVVPSPKDREAKEVQKRGSKCNWSVSLSIHDLAY